MNLRVYLMIPSDLKPFQPDIFTQSLKAAGFKFDSDACPIKLMQPWDKHDLGDGYVLWRQWDDPNATA